MENLRVKILEALAAGTALRNVKTADEPSANSPQLSLEGSAEQQSEKILNEAFDKATLAEQLNEPVVIIMKDLADGYDFYKPKGWTDYSTCKPEWLIEGGVARRVFDKLAEAGLSPSIPKEFEHGLDISEGFYIVIPTNQALATSGVQPVVPTPATQDSVSAQVRICVFRMTTRSVNPLVADRTWCQLSTNDFGYKVGQRGSDDLGGPELEPDRELIGYLDIVAAAGELEELVIDPNGQLDIGN